MRPRFVTIFVFCALALVASAQQSDPESAQSQTPNAEKHAAGPEAPKPESKGHDYSRESFVIEKMHSTYRFEADGTGRKETVARIRVQMLHALDLHAPLPRWPRIQA